MYYKMQENLFCHKLKDSPRSNPKLPKVIALKNGPRLELPEITPDKVNSLFYVWIEHFQSVYFSNYLDYFAKKRKDLGQGCQCCPPGDTGKALQGGANTGEAPPGDADTGKATPGEALNFENKITKRQEIHILDGHTKFGNLHIVIDSVNILRVKTRSSNSFDFNYRFPILLPKDAHFQAFLKCIAWKDMLVPIKP